LFFDLFKGSLFFLIYFSQCLLIFLILTWYQYLFILYCLIFNLKVLHFSRKKLYFFLKANHQGINLLSWHTETLTRCRILMNSWILINWAFESISLAYWLWGWCLLPSYLHILFCFLVVVVGTGFMCDLLWNVCYMGYSLWVVGWLLLIGLLVLLLYMQTWIRILKVMFSVPSFRCTNLVCLGYLRSLWILKHLLCVQVFTSWIILMYYFRFLDFVKGRCIRRFQ